ncbi:hypothetical protein [Amycolatopsis pigmentata]|uniref:DUF732 domain-containing protein n=1 Tax=Amycolatopsis pigmentata TaxID=450801 RepID=A0ABW5G5X7_9PSEU
MSADRSAADRLRLLSLGLVTLALTACSGQEAGPTPHGGGGQATTPDALAVKLRALNTDECWRTPVQQAPQGCAKYVNELGSTVGMIREQPGFTAQADGLAKEVADYHAAHCETVPAPGDPCSRTLTDIAATLTATRDKLDTQVTSR